MIPGSANPLLLASAAGSPAPSYQIERSLRFNSSDSGYLSRVPSVSGNRKTWTWAGWAKGPFNAATFPRVFNVEGPSAGYRTTLRFTSSSLIEAYSYDGTNFQWQLTSSQVFRDPSAWFHLILAVDTTQATSSNRVKLYVNGVQVTAFSTASYPSLNFDTGVNHTSPHTIGGGQALSAYLADVHFIDGQALDPTSFGEFDANGVWQPKAYTGTYGTNGFHLPFSDNSTAAALGTDTSGAGNNWTVNNISVAAGSGNDSLVDTPTNYGTDDGMGGSVRGNYATLNPLSGASAHPLGNGNLEKVSTSGSGNRFGTIGITSGKFYWEASFTVVAAARESVGISSNGRDANDTAGLKVYEDTGTKYDGSSSTSYGASWGANDVLGVAFDADNGTLVFYKNGVSQGTAFSSLSTSVTWFPVFRDDGGCSGWINFGQRQWAYAPPAGFKALCTTNLPEPLVAKPSEVMDVVTWSGNGASSRNISGTLFQPDLVWLKNRSGTTWHNVIDSVRGASRDLFTNATNAEVLNDTTGTVSAFNSDGFTVAAGSVNASDVNSSGSSYVAWTWDAGSSTVTNTQGSITSQVRANPGAGVSIVSYTGTGALATVGHGLNAAPNLIIFKNRDRVEAWPVYHVSTGATHWTRLDGTNAATASSTFLNNTAPTSSVFTINTWAALNASTEKIIAYCFAPVAGYSAFGSYTGNGSTDGPFVYTGMRPRWIMFKRVAAADPWIMYDSSRSPYNQLSVDLAANDSRAEASTTAVLDFTSNGFKLRNSGTIFNQNGSQYIYMCFAENPFQYARAR